MFEEEEEEGKKGERGKELVLITYANRAWMVGSFMREESPFSPLMNV